MTRDKAKRQQVREFSIRLTEDEYARLEARAAAAGMSRGECARRDILRAWRAEKVSAAMAREQVG